jgi:hypothetical protein
LLPAGYVVHADRRSYGPLRHPLGSIRFPGLRLYAPTAPGPRSQGQGGLLQFRPSPSTRSTPHTAGGSSTLHLQDLHVFPGLHRDTPGSAPPWSPHGVGLTPRQASLYAADRMVAPPTCRALDTGLQHRAFPPRHCQSATRLPDDYRDGTLTRRRQPASEHPRSDHQTHRPPL